MVKNPKSSPEDDGDPREHWEFEENALPKDLDHDLNLSSVAYPVWFLIERDNLNLGDSSDLKSSLHSITDFTVLNTPGVPATTKSWR